MRFEVPARLNAARVTKGRYASKPKDGFNGVFVLPVGGVKLVVIATDGIDPVVQSWEHVSVSLADKSRLPTWEEMSTIKQLFWSGDETVVQFHPPTSQYVDNAPVLHLWRHCQYKFPLPPTYLVGDKKTGTFTKDNIKQAEVNVDREIERVRSKLSEGGPTYDQSNAD